VTGRGGHAAIPQEFRDPIAAGAAIVTGVQNVVPRNLEPADPVVVSVTSFQSSSSAYNVIPSDVEIRGTVRYLNPELADHFPESLRSLAENIAAAHGVSASVEYEKGCPPTVNSEKEAETARRVAAHLVGADNIFESPPKMGGEDFSFFLERKPGAFAFIGNGEGSHCLHNPCYDFNDEILPVGASYFVRLAESILK
jgi:hippurate hydrolase